MTAFLHVFTLTNNSLLFDATQHKQNNVFDTKKKI
ncbi:allophanate hydrolase, partial [Pseudoalteromonas sp. S1731]